MQTKKLLFFFAEILKNFPPQLATHIARHAGNRIKTQMLYK